MGQASFPCSSGCLQQMARDKTRVIYHSTSVVKITGREDYIQHNASKIFTHLLECSTHCHWQISSRNHFGRVIHTHLSMVLRNTAERLKSYLSPPENLQSVCRFKTEDSVWVRDDRPNGIHKWTNGTIVTPVGTLTYNANMKGSNNRKVHVDHLFNHVPVRYIVQVPFTTPASGSRNQMIPVTSQHIYSCRGGSSGRASQAKAGPLFLL